MTLSDRQAVEYFHLVFLRALVARGEDKKLIALKGGCNLRFYFESVRYSEDIDLDVSVIAKSILKNKVDKLFESPLLLMPLKSKGLMITDSSAPKQTDTTQRWKIGLKVGATHAVLRTKIEFSRRDNIVDALTEPCSDEISKLYGLPPVLAGHYSKVRAIDQKIHALAERPIPQARDVFDLHLLFNLVPSMTLIKPSPDRIASALEHAMNIQYDEYAAQVVSYLEPHHAALYEEKISWENIQQFVVRQLEKLL